jgi:thiol-disulfide isomerase/thioredoxin
MLVGGRRVWETKLKRVLQGAILLAVTAAILSCGERFPDPGQEGEFERTVLLEEGTGTWCPNCPAAAENIEELLESHPGELVVLALHWGEIDPYSSQETEARLSKLGVAAFPTIIFDGVESYEGARPVEEMERVLADRRKLGSPLKLELSAALTADSVLYEIAVIASAKIAESIEANLRIALVEDTLTDASAGLLHHTVRRLPEAAGEDALTIEPGDTVNLHRALPLDASWGRPLAALVWIEAQDLNVYQAASYELGGGSPDEGEFSIEVASDTIQTKPGLGDSANYYFNLKNHTNNTLTLTVDLPADSLELPPGWGASICHEGSCYPIPFDVQVTANGASQEFHLTITSGTEGTEGKVVMEVTAGGAEVDRQTFILRIAP